MKNNLKIILFYVVIIGAILLAIALLLGKSKGEAETFDKIMEYFRNEQVTEFRVDDKNVLYLKLKTDNKVVEYKLSSISLNLLFNKTELTDLILDQMDRKVIDSGDFEPESDISIWVSILPYVVVIILFVVGWFFFLNQTTGGKAGRAGGFGRAKARFGADEKKKVFFKDVAGCDEEKEELEEIVDYVRDPSRFTQLGAKIPHGVLLVGPPGTGKTLLAKAVAGEANVPFYSISGSDFVEMYVGVGASRVRDLFETAKKNPAAIIFIDEIDAVGRIRGAGLGGGQDEREQTLNQLLVEMDGFGNNEGVVVMAATNRPDTLDPALLRPGRFDRRITVGYPDMKGREDILAVHAKGKPFEDEVKLSEIAKTTAGYTGADLANLLNEAALLAARKGKTLIGMNDIEEAETKIMVGPAKKNRKRKEEETRLCAYHEAGHAITAFYCSKHDPVKQISIIQSNSTGGYTLYAPEDDTDLYNSSKSFMKESIVSLLGGRVAEKLILGDISTGASSDISRATDIARDMVTRYGMSDLLGPVVYGSGHGNDEVFLGRDYGSSRNYSESTASEIDKEIRALVEEGYQKAKAILEEHTDQLHFVAQYLIEHETMDADQFRKAMSEGGATPEELEEMVAEKKKKSEEENKAREKLLAERRRRQDEEERRREEAAKKDPAANADSFAARVREMQENAGRGSDHHDGDNGPTPPKD